MSIMRLIECSNWEYIVMRKALGEPRGSIECLLCLQYGEVSEVLVSRKLHRIQVVLTLASAHSSVILCEKKKALFGNMYPDSNRSSSLEDLEVHVRKFRGTWRQQTKQYHQIRYGKGHSPSANLNLQLLPDMISPRPFQNSDVQTATCKSHLQIQILNTNLISLLTPHKWNLRGIS